MATAASPETPRSRSRSRSRSSTGTSVFEDTTMNDASPRTSARPRPSPRAHARGAASERAREERDMGAFRFLDLPRELRDRVYMYALVSPYPFLWPNPASTPVHDVAVGLLRVSKHIHEEAAPVLYTQNKFLFTHPSDCTIFRVISSPFSENINAVYFRIRDKDVKMWTKYLGSKQAERSMRADLPKLKTMWIFLKCAPMMSTPGMIGHLGAGPGPGPGVGPGGIFHHGGHAGGLAQHLQGLQGFHNTLGGQLNAHMTALQQQVQHQIQALQHQLQQAIGHTHQGQTAAYAPHYLPLQQQQHALFQSHGPHANHPPTHPSPLAQVVANSSGPSANPNGPAPTPTPPPQPAYYHNLHLLNGNAHPYPLYASFLRWEHEMGLDQICLALHETRPAEADIKLVCIVRMPNDEVDRLLRLFPDELSLDRNGDARTRFRRVYNVEVSLEVSGYETTVGAPLL